MTDPRDVERCPSRPARALCVQSGVAFGILVAARAVPLASEPWLWVPLVAANAWLLVRMGRTLWGVFEHFGDEPAGPAAHPPRLTPTRRPVRRPRATVTRADSVAGDPASEPPSGLGMVGLP